MTLFCISITAHANSNWVSFVADIKAKSKFEDADSKGILSSFIEMDGVGGTYNEAFKLASDSSAKDSFYGHYSLGKILKNGRGVSQNSKKAKELFSKSVPLILKEAEKGNPVCQYLAAECYNFGHGVDLNATLAERWSKKSINRGFIVANHQLAISCMNQQKTDKYLSHLKIAAENGFAASQLALYGYYSVFALSKSDQNQSKEWFEKARNQNCASLTKIQPDSTSEPVTANPVKKADLTNKNSEISEKASNFTKDSKENIQLVIEKIQPTAEQISYLTQAVKSLFKNTDCQDAQNILSQNDNVNWGPDAQSVICVRPVITRGLEEIPMGVCQLWWPEKKLLLSLDRLEYSTTQGTGKFNIHNRIILRRTDDKFNSIIFVENNKLLMGSGESIFDGTPPESMYNFEYALMKSVDWHNKIVENGASDQPFVKEIKLPNGNSSTFILNFEGVDKMMLMKVTDKTASFDGKPYTGYNSGLYFNNGIGYREYLRGSVKNFEDIGNYLKYSDYLKAILFECYDEHKNKQKTKTDFIDSLN